MNPTVLGRTIQSISSFNGSNNTLRLVRIIATDGTVMEITGDRHETYDTRGLLERIDKAEGRADTTAP